MSRPATMSLRIQNTVYRGVIFTAATWLTLTSGTYRANAQSVEVVWANIVNATATGTTLQKTAGCDGCDDAGASSQQTLSADGFVEFTIGEMGTFWIAGLNHSDDT